MNKKFSYYYCNKIIDNKINNIQCVKYLNIKTPNFLIGYLPNIPFTGKELLETIFLLIISANDGKYDSERSEAIWAFSTVMKDIILYKYAICNYGFV